MLSARPGPRTSTCTWFATCDRKTAAWPGRVAAADDHDLLALTELRSRGGSRCSRRRCPRSAAASAAPACGSARRWRRRSRACAPRRRPRGGSCTAGRRTRCARPSARSRPRRRTSRAWVSARPASACARDAGGKAEVVLDARAGAGLAAGRRALEHQHVEALGRGVDRGGEAGRAGADDHHVAHLLRIERAAQPQRGRELFDAGVPQQVSLLAEHDRDLVDADVEAVEQRLHVGLGLDVLVGERLAVAGQELLEVQRRRRVARAESTRSLLPSTSSASRRRMNARIRISLSSESRCTSCVQVRAVDGDDLAVGDAARRAPGCAAPTAC